MSSSCSVCVSAECTSRTKVRSHEANHTWTIEDFDFYEAKGEPVESSLFSSVTNDKVKWYLKFKPNGETDAKDTTSIYLYLSPVSALEKNKRIFAKITFYILDTERKEVLKEALDVFEISSWPTKSWGLGEFFIKDENFRNELLSNNQLTIRCDVTFSDMDDDSNSIRQCNCKIRMPECNFFENLSSLFENQELTDVVLSAKGKDYPAHKTILAARSPVFRAMFKHDMKENGQNRIDIEDINEDVLREMLRYIYTGNCENLIMLADGLLAAANKYDLDRLKMMCAEALFKNLSVENATNTLVLADMHNANELKREAIRYIAARFAEVLNSTGWKNILVSNPELVNEVCQAVARR